MIRTERTRIEPVSQKHVELLLRYYTENREHLSRWEPQRDAEFYTMDHWKEFTSNAEKAFEFGRDYRFVALTSDRNEVIAVCNFFGVTRGVFQACYLGYSIAEKYEGQGLMLEILEPVIEYMFKEVGLHRIMANYIPTNERSGRLLKRLGFEREGYARKYLKIAGKWQDHIMMARIVD